MTSRVDDLLEQARRELDRLTPHQVLDAAHHGALIVDTRTAAQRRIQGDLDVPGCVVIDRTVLEWRLDPTGPWRIAEAADPNRLVVVVCRQGYSSSLAAASLRRIGLSRATDMIGGVEAWTIAGLPLRVGADVRI